MTKLLEQAVATARNLPPEMQDDIARIMLSYAGGDEKMIELSPEEEPDLIEAQAEMTRGEFATDAEVQTVLSNIGGEAYSKHAPNYPRPSPL